VAHCGAASLRPTDRSRRDQSEVTRRAGRCNRGGLFLGGAQEHRGQSRAGLSRRQRGASSFDQRQHILRQSALRAYVFPGSPGHLRRCPAGGHNDEIDEPKHRDRFAGVSGMAPASSRRISTIDTPPASPGNAWISRRQPEDKCYTSVVQRTISQRAEPRAIVRKHGWLSTLVESEFENFSPVALI